MNPIATQEKSCPLYVDLDGTLVKQDTLHESILAVLKRRPWLMLNMLKWLVGGKAYFKKQLGFWVQQGDIIPVVDQEWIKWLREQKNTGRPIYLATAADFSIAQQMAAHFGFFDGVIATSSPDQGKFEDGQLVNLSGVHKIEAIKKHMLLHQYPEFDYAGNSSADLPIWAQARKPIAVNAPKSIINLLQANHANLIVFGRSRFSLTQVLKSMRLSQWSKNCLLFVPVLAAHELSLTTLIPIMVAFLAFGFLASSTYFINDLLDLSNDRPHAHKRHRPLASCQLMVGHAVPICAALMLSGLGLAWWLSETFFLIMLAYTFTTLAYSLKFKTLPIFDVLILSGLYSLRLFAGASVVSITISNWLLTVSLFLFLGLALVKRCAELEEVTLNAEINVARGRGYHQDDISILRAMGVASSFATVLVLALYIDTQSSSALYPSAQWLWGAIPLMLFWLMRLWVKTSRRELHGEDPLQFAIYDKASWIVLALLAALTIIASKGA